jgi:hypothetical protein
MMLSRYQACMSRRRLVYNRPMSGVEFEDLERLEYDIQQDQLHGRGVACFYRHARFDRVKRRLKLGLISSAYPEQVVAW